MKKTSLLLLLAVASVTSFAQMKAGSKVFVEYEQTPGEVNADATDITNMFIGKVIGYTSLDVVESKEEADFTLEFSLIEKNLGNRKGKVSVIDNKSSSIIFESEKWQRGSPNAYNGMSGSRDCVGRLVKYHILKAFPQTKK